MLSGAETAAARIVDGMELPTPFVYTRNDATRIERLELLKARVEVAREFLKLAVDDLRKELSHD